MLRNFGLAAMALAAAAAAPAVAANYSATLSGLQQSMPNDSGASGKGLATLSSNDNIFTAKLSWTGLSAPAAEGHVHCCALPGDDAPIALSLAPMAVETGSLTRRIDLTKLSSYSSEFLAAYGGTAAAARTEFLSGLKSGQAYFNIHDAVFPAGEIRGQIAAGGAGAVPEPASWSLMIAGFALAGGALRRRRNVNVVAA